MMHMTFYWSREVTLLFDPWKTVSWTSYGLTLLACLLFSIFYQYMEARRQQFQLLCVNTKPSSAAATQTTIDTPLLYPKLAAASRIWSPARLAGAVLFGVNSAIGYLLMLAIMSFNGGVFAAVVAGLSVGYLVFRSSSADVVVVDNPCACA